jgi:hypothetical protein
MFSVKGSVLLRKVSEIPLVVYKVLSADWLHRFNFFTILIKMEYLKLNIEAVPAYSNIKKPINLTSGCPKNQNRCWNNIGSPPPAGS